MPHLQLRLRDYNIPKLIKKLRKHVPDFARMVAVVMYELDHLYTDYTKKEGESGRKYFPSREEIAKDTNRLLTDLLADWMAHGRKSEAQNWTLGCGGITIRLDIEEGAAHARLAFDLLDAEEWDFRPTKPVKDDEED